MGETEEGGNLCLVLQLSAREMTNISQGTAFSLLILEADKLFTSLLGLWHGLSLLPLFQKGWLT